MPATPVTRNRRSQAKAGGAPRLRSAARMVFPKITQRLKILLIDRRGKPGIAKVDHRPPQGYILIFAKRKQPGIEFFGVAIRVPERHMPDRKSVV